MPEKVPKLAVKTKSSAWKKGLISALIFAIIGSYWFVAHPREMNLMVRLELYGLPEFLTIVQAPSKTFEVRVRGCKSAIEKLKGAELTYPVNLSDRREGIQSIIIDSENLKLPDEISVVRVSAGETTLKLEKTIQKRIPIDPRVTGNPSFGYRVTEKRANPFSLVLKGPESRLTPLEAIPTHPLDISGAVETMRKEITLDLPEGVVPDPFQKSLDATIVIEEDRAEKKLANVSINGRNCIYEYIIRPEKVCLTVNGPVLAFNQGIPTGEISVHLDLDGLSPGVHVKPAVIDLPEGMRLVNAEPKVFTVEITKNRKRKN